MIAVLIVKRGIQVGNFNRKTDPIVLIQLVRMGKLECKSISVRRRSRPGHLPCNKLLAYTPNSSRICTKPLVMADGPIARSLPLHAMCGFTSEAGYTYFQSQVLEHG
jgi:hypothetical protein